MCTGIKYSGIKDAGYWEHFEEEMKEYGTKLFKQKKGESDWNQGENQMD